MPYQEIELCYLSGTGNTFRVARWIGEIITGGKIRFAMHPLEEAPAAIEKGTENRHLTGFLTPTHGFITPWWMIRYALRLPRQKGTHAFVIATRGKIAVGPVQVPGLEGTAAYLVALILALKGFKVRGVMGVDMPSNWTALHPALSPHNVEKIIVRAKAKIMDFAGRILGGNICFRGIIPLLLGVGLLPVSLLYLFAGRFFLAKLYFASNQCKGCGFCAENCLCRAIRMIGKKKPRPYWTYSCENCMRCMSFCPSKAVEVGHSWCIILYFLSTIPVSTYLANRLGYHWADAGLLNGLPTRLFIQYLFFLGAVFAAYGLFWILIRIPLVNTIFTWTTFTHLYRRYHEPATTAECLSAGQLPLNRRPSPASTTP